MGETATQVESGLQLQDGSTVGIIGGGPAGSLFAILLRDMAELIDLDLDITIYEPRDYTVPGPKGCNGCGGIISESLVQLLATEGVSIPGSVVQRGIESYVVHTPERTVKIQTPAEEKRIAAVHRGAGPRGGIPGKWDSFDGFLLDLAKERGAKQAVDKVASLRIGDDGRPTVAGKDGAELAYDMLAVAGGLNSGLSKLVEGLGLEYEPPKTARTHLREIYLGQEVIDGLLGDSMHVFLLNIRGIEFGALIPKGDYVTLCLLGDDITKELVDEFIESPQVASFLPEGADTAGACRCQPSINVGAAKRPYADRLVFIGDCGASRLYKDGIGAAYRTAKAAAVTAVFQGLSSADFENYFKPACDRIEKDNDLGRLVFFATDEIQKRRFAREGLMHMVTNEQIAGPSTPQRMSSALWDTFTGSGAYADIFKRSLHPAFIGRLGLEISSALVRPSRSTDHVDKGVM